MIDLKEIKEDSNYLILTDYIEVVGADPSVPVCVWGGWYHLNLER